MRAIYERVIEQLIEGAINHSGSGTIATENKEEFEVEKRHKQKKLDLY